MEPLIAALAPALAMHADQPFALFGHSMGGLVAFEVAHALVAQGIIPTHLFVSGCSTPELRAWDEPVYSLPDDQLIMQLRSLAGTPMPVLDNPMLLELLLPIIRADYAVFETYRYQPRPPLPVPITCLAGMQDPLVAQEHLPLWEAHTTSPSVIHRFPGGHFFLQDAVDDVLAIIARHLAVVGSEAVPHASGPPQR
jgi:medium-chain acyl-[acyl-carrier-protein] hydrolase